MSTVLSHTDPTAPVTTADEAITTAAETEETLWQGSVSHWHYAGKWTLVLLALGLMVGTFFFVPQLVSSGLNPGIVRAILGGIMLGLIGWISLDRRRRKYRVTNRRVSVEYGLVSTRSNELRIQDIRSINLTTTGISGLVGIGRVEFATAATDDAEVIFWNVPGAQRIRDLVRSLQTVAVV